MAEFTTDWSVTREWWPEMFEARGLVGKPKLSFLEIGCFEGRATIWLLENVLTDPSSEITVIDTFRGSQEFELMGVDGDSWGRFKANTQLWAERIRVERGRSIDVLRDWSHLDDLYDFVYIDGSHMAADVLTDSVLVWPLVKLGGVIVWDDLTWGDPDGYESPARGIMGFLNAFGDRCELVHQGDQLAVAKLRA